VEFKAGLRQGWLVLCLAEVPGSWVAPVVPLAEAFSAKVPINPRQV